MVSEYDTIPLRQVQHESAIWREQNFQKAPGWGQLLGMGEELGEAFHAYLKRDQGIRGTSEEHTAALRDAIGDLIIFTMGFCDTEKWDLEEIVSDTWREVMARDWTKRPETG